MLSVRPEELEDLVVPEAEEPPISLVNVIEEAEKSLRHMFSKRTPNSSANDIEECLGVLRHIYRGNQVKSITQTKPAFINLCHIMGVIDRQGNPYSPSTNDTKSQMYEALQKHQAVRLDMHFEF